MVRYIEEFEVVRHDAYHEGLDILREVERKSNLETVTWVPANRHTAVVRGGVAQRLFDAGFTDEEIKGLIRPWADAWVGAQIQTALDRLQTKPQLAVTKNLIRDSQKTRVYRAQARIPEGAKIGPTEIERYVAEVMADPWFKLHHPEVEITDIKFAWPKKGKQATCTTNGKVHTLKFPEALRSRKYVIHELAHAAANAKWDGHRIAGHGAEFSYVFLRLVYRRFGKSVGFALHNAFQDLRVSTGPRLKPLAQVTEEERDAETPTAGY